MVYEGELAWVGIPSQVLFILDCTHPSTREASPVRVTPAFGPALTAVSLARAAVCSASFRLCAQNGTAVGAQQPAAQGYDRWGVGGGGCGGTSRAGTCCTPWETSLNASCRNS